MQYLYLICLFFFSATDYILAHIELFQWMRQLDSFDYFKYSVFLPNEKRYYQRFSATNVVVINVFHIIIIIHIKRMEYARGGFLCIMNKKKNL